jgi:hypothetical protein
MYLVLLYLCGRSLRHGVPNPPNNLPDSTHRLSSSGIEPFNLLSIKGARFMDITNRLLTAVVTGRL